MKRCWNQSPIRVPDVPCFVMDFAATIVTREKIEKSCEQHFLGYLSIHVRHRSTIELIADPGPIKDQDRFADNVQALMKQICRPDDPPSFGIILH